MKIKAGFYQFKPQFGKVDVNLKKVIHALENAQANLIVLPELAFTGYHFKDRNELADMAENIRNSKIVDSLTQLCHKNDFFIATGFAEKFEDKNFNSALFIGPEGVIHTYRKLHLFNEEKNIFDPGDIPLCVNNMNGIKIGLMVCWDWIYPEVARKLAVKGADIICHPANLVLPYCQYSMVTRSMENNIFTITANRFGSDKRPHGSIKFTGKSQIVAPKGKLIYQAKSQKEELYITELDINEARNKKMTKHNDIVKDRRPEFY